MCWRRLELLRHRAQACSFMFRRLLHVLLVLTLTLNGISAPWAMGRMNHAGHGEGAHGDSAHGAIAIPASHHSSHAVDSTHPAMAHAGHHGHEATADGATSAPHEPDAIHADACCDGITCQCGCVLPPVLAFVRLEVPSFLIEHARFEPLVAHLVERRDSPPFRPPAAV